MDLHVLLAEGVLDSSTYRTLRDSVIKAALDEPRAVIVDVSDLVVPAESAWAVFTSARWHIGQWLDVPLLLVCSHRVARETIERNGITRYVRVYSTIDEAIASLSRTDERPVRYRARTELPRVLASVARSRELVTEWLTAWSQQPFIPSAKMVVTVLVENVLAHTDSAPVLRLETNGTTVTVAVEDQSTVLAGRREAAIGGGDRVSGLAILAAMCRHWGNAPTPTGKTVWAVIAPGNCL